MTYEWETDIESITSKPIVMIETGGGDAHCIWLASYETTYDYTCEADKSECYRLIGEDLL